MSQTNHKIISEESNKTQKRQKQQESISKLTYELIINEQESNQCPYCEKKYKNKYILQTHICSIHRQSPLKCKQCNAKFTSLGNLKYHIQQYHLLKNEKLSQKQKKQLIDISQMNQGLHQELKDSECSCGVENDERPRNYWELNFELNSDGNKNSSTLADSNSENRCLINNSKQFSKTYLEKYVQQPNQNQSEGNSLKRKIQISDLCTDLKDYIKKKTIFEYKERQKINQKCFHKGQQEYKNDNVDNQEEQILWNTTSESIFYMEYGLN